MFRDKEIDVGEFSSQARTLNRNDLNPTRGMRWAKLVDTAEQSLYWLVPAITLAYIVFRILPRFSS